VRRARLGDYQAVAALNREVQRFHADHYPSLFKASAAETLTPDAYEEWLAAPDGLVVVAVEGDGVVGYVWAAVVDREETAYRVALRDICVHQICVAGAVRGRGHGGQLMAAIREHAALLAIRRIELNTGRPIRRRAASSRPRVSVNSMFGWRRNWADAAEGSGRRVWGEVAERELPWPRAGTAVAEPGRSRACTRLAYMVGPNTAGGTRCARESAVSGPTGRLESVEMTAIGYRWPFWVPGRARLRILVRTTRTYARSSADGSSGRSGTEGSADCPSIA
jgi:GNAT superfamily N-acetyltransferase